MFNLEQLLQPAMGYLTLGMWEDAWEELENLPPELRAHDAVLELRISIYQGMGKWEPARVLAESLAKQCPGNPQWWILWAYSLRREKSVEEARAVLMEAAIHHPDEPLIPYNLGCYACVEDDLETSYEFLKQAFRMQPELRKIAFDDPDLARIFDKNFSEPAPAFDPPPESDSP